MRGKLLSAAVAVVAVALIVLGCTSSATDVTPPAEKKRLVYAEDGVAVKGYDVVAYFTEGAPVEGSEEFTTEHDGVTWRFSSAENLTAFEESPERYAPQYGGYCAWGIAAKNDLFEIDPEAWKIVDEKLYLNFNKEVQTQWLEDVPGFIEKGDVNWAALQGTDEATEP